MLLAHLRCSTDEALKTGGYLEDALFDPKIAKSYDPTETAFNLAFNTKLSAWQWLETPENAHRLTRFGLAMRGARQATSPDAILDGRWRRAPRLITYATNLPTLRVWLEELGARRPGRRCWRRYRVTDSQNCAEQCPPALRDPGSGARDEGCRGGK